MAQVKHIDPDRMRFRRKVLVPLFNNAAGYWYLTTVAPRIDATVTPATRGWLSSLPGTPLLLCTTTGARTGKPRVHPLMYWSREGDVVLMASNFGRDRHPAWLYNMRANPIVTLEFRGRRGPYRARVTVGAERDKLWETSKDFIANYRSYEQRVGDKRHIEVVICSPLN